MLKATLPWGRAFFDSPREFGSISGKMEIRRLEWIRTGRRVALAVLLGSVAGVAAPRGPAEARGAGPQSEPGTRDCQTPGSPVEAAVCSLGELADADTALREALARLLPGLPAASAAGVRADQLQWEQWVRTLCRAEEAQPAPALAVCLLDPYHERVLALAKASSRSGGQTFLMRTVALYRRDQGDDPPGTQYPGFGDLLVSWPVAQTETPEWTAWNAAVKLEVRRLVAPSDAALAAAGSEAWPAEWAKGRDAEVSVTAPEVVGDRVSVGLGEDFQAHGVDAPAEHGYYFHWLLREQREMRIEDVFRPGTKWSAVMVKQCVEAVERQLGDEYDYSEDGPIEPSLQALVGASRNWKIGPQGLTVVIPKFSVAPEARPVDDVTVPWKKLRRFLVDGFVVEEDGGS